MKPRIAILLVPAAIAIVVIISALLLRRDPGASRPALSPVERVTPAGKSAEVPKSIQTEASDGSVRKAVVSPKPTGISSPVSASLRKAEAEAGSKVAELRQRDDRRNDFKRKMDALRARIAALGKGHSDQRLLELQMEELKRLREEADNEFVAFLSELDRWLAEDSKRQLGYYRHLRDVPGATDPDGAGHPLAPFYDNEELEGMVLDDLRSLDSEYSALLALEVVKVKGTPARIEAVSMAVASGPTERVRQESVVVARGYKADGNNIGFRNALFQTLVASASDKHPAVRLEALMSLSVEREATPSMVALVSNMAKSDPDDEVRLVADRVLRKWETK